LEGAIVNSFQKERRTNQKEKLNTILMVLIYKVFINGVSSHKIERLARSLRIGSISLAQVSEINKALSQ